MILEYCMLAYTQTGGQAGRQAGLYSNTDILRGRQERIPNVILTGKFFSSTIFEVPLHVKHYHPISCYHT